MFSKPRLLLVDTDTLIYAAATRAEVNTDWGDGQWSLTANLYEGKSNFKLDLKRLLKLAEADEFRLALSDYDNPRWREGVLDSYKSHRKGRRPLIYDPLRKWLAAHPKASTVPHLEGDDILGMWMTNPDFAPLFEKVCCSIDKDLRQVPGLHINYQHARDNGNWEPETVTEEAANRFHMFQTLTGDAVDGYKGLPGCGPKGAEKILGGVTADLMGPLVVAAYEKAGLTAEDALIQARVARILRHEDYDYTRGEVILWSPRTPAS